MQAGRSASFASRPAAEARKLRRVVLHRGRFFSIAAPRRTRRHSGCYRRRRWHRELLSSSRVRSGCKQGSAGAPAMEGRRSSWMIARRARAALIAASSSRTCSSCCHGRCCVVAGFRRLWLLRWGKRLLGCQAGGVHQRHRRHARLRREGSAYAARMLERAAALRPVAHRRCWRAAGRRIASHSFAPARTSAAPKDAAASSDDALLLLTLCCAPWQRGSACTRSCCSDEMPVNALRAGDAGVAELPSLPMP
jgi:hypothetical protein